MARQLLAAVASIFAIGVACPGLAQDVAAPAACELHVWPAAGLDSMFYGWTHGSTVNGSAKKRAGYPALPDDPLSVATQRAALAEVPMARLFGLRDATIVIHDQPLDRREQRADAPRHDSSAASCYNELIVAKIFYEEAVYSDRSLRVMFAFREFGAAPAPTATFTTWAETSLAFFPPKSAGEMAAALGEVRDGFKASIRDFAASRADHVRALQAARR